MFIYFIEFDDSYPLLQHRIALFEVVFLFGFTRFLGGLKRDEHILVMEPKRP